MGLVRQVVDENYRWEGRIVRRCPNCGYRLSARKTREQTKVSYRKGQHEYLVGALAHALRRIEIYKNAGGDAHLFDTDRPDLIEDLKSATCQGCVEPHLVDWNSGEWHHACPLRKKCDSVACALYTCAMWHRIYGHKRREPRWSK